MDDALVSVEMKQMLLPMLMVMTEVEKPRVVFHLDWRPFCASFNGRMSDPVQLQD